jgi:general secretion pathway protein K
MNVRSRQRGVALLIALLVVALATVLIAGLADRGELSAARTRNVLRAEQADAYARGLEAFAAKVLVRDFEQNGDYDASGDLWSMPMPPTPVPGGTIGASLRDMNGCFNLNNLRPGNPAVPQQKWAERFRNLLNALQIDPTLTEVVVDWLDDDGEPGGGTQGGGAEDSAYSALDPPYRAANRTFGHVTELRLVQGVTPAIYAKLAPHVCALPPGSLINVNTATPAVLRAIDKRITDEVANRLWNEGRARWQSVEGLFAELAQQNIPMNDVEKIGLGVKSRYFFARGDILLDGLPFRPTSLIDREGMRVLQRTRGSD